MYRAEAVGHPGRLLAVEHLVAAEPLLTLVSQDLERRRHCQHPHLLPVLDVVPTRTGIAVVSPATPGGSLADALTRAPGGLPAPVVAATGARIASALQALHDHGSLQGTITLEDVRFDAGGRPLLAGALTSSGHPRPERSGTPPVDLTVDLAPCAPPGDLPAPAASDDLVALGAVLSTALVGSPPGTAPGPDRPLAGGPRNGPVAPEPPAQLVDAPRSLLEAIAQATARDPNDRPASAAQLASLLDRAARDAAPTSPSPSAARDAAPTSPSPSAAEVGEAQPTPHAEPRPEAEPTPGAEPTPEAEPTGERPRRPIRRSLTLVALLLTAAAVLPVALPDSDRSRPAPARTSASLLPAAPDPVCEDVAPPDGAGELLLVGLEGRSCATPIRWDGRQLSVAVAGGPPRRLLLDADPQDQLLTADLDCRGRDALVLYRPGTGEVFILDRLAAPGEEIEVTGQPSGAVGGHATVHPGVDGCDRIVVIDPG
ncbi:MAG: hypothetical protein EA387_14170 [Nitriliruptor sp.]|nr:MAG: hypothetical protein EA387_14170 [Nitriliruptor sp.]